VGIGHFNTETPWEYPGLTPTASSRRNGLDAWAVASLEEQIIELLLVIATAPGNPRDAGRGPLVKKLAGLFIAAGLPPIPLV
jgi:hypothetical protein